MVTTTTAAPRRTKPTSLLAAWPALLALCLTQLVEMIDNSVLTIALPTIGRDLGASPTDLQWFIGAYSLTFGGLLSLATHSATSWAGAAHCFLALAFSVWPD